MGNSNHGVSYRRVDGDDGERRPWHYIYVCSIESRLIMRVRYDTQETKTLAWWPRPRRRGCRRRLPSKWFSKVNSPTKSSTCCSLLLS